MVLLHRRSRDATAWIRVLRRFQVRCRLVSAVGERKCIDRTDTQDRRHSDLCRSSKEVQPAFSTSQKPRPCCRTRSRRIGAFTLVCSSWWKTTCSRSWTNCIKGIWSAMRSSGSVIGGAINFSTNYDRASAGGIAWSTYLIFVGCGTLIHRLDGTCFTDGSQNAPASCGPYRFLQPEKSAVETAAKSQHPERFRGRRSSPHSGNTTRCEG
jgi:hypothetical protein